PPFIVSMNGTPVRAGQPDPTIIDGISKPSSLVHLTASVSDNAPPARYLAPVRITALPLDLTAASPEPNALRGQILALVGHFDDSDSYRVNIDLLAHWPEDLTRQIRPEWRSQLAMAVGKRQVAVRLRANDIAVEITCSLSGSGTAVLDTMRKAASLESA